MKKTNKYIIGILFIFGFLFTGSNIANADAITGEVTVTIDPVVPTLTTTAITAITSITATSGGNISDSGGANITARGVVWDVLVDPTIEDSKTSNDTGTGSFVSNLTGLTPNTTYYVRAYATNSAGTGYGDQISFRTANVIPLAPTGLTITPASPSCTTTTLTISWNPSAGATAYKLFEGVTGTGTLLQNNNLTSFSHTGLNSGSHGYSVRAYNDIGESTYVSKVVTIPVCGTPVLTTNSITAITQNTATSGGNITSDGGAPIIARGVVWNIFSSPTIGNSKTTDGTDTGSYSSSLSGLAPDQMYYVRAYATNSVGTAYGNNVTFTTLPISVPTVVTSPVITDLRMGSNNIITATVGGEITSGGGATSNIIGGVTSGSSSTEVVTSSNFCGSGIGPYTCYNFPLPVGINNTFYIKAKATNNAGTAYGISIFGNTNLPTVTTVTPAKNITKTSATVEANLVSNGGTTVYSAGIILGTTNTNLTIDSSNYKTAHQGWADYSAWADPITNLTPGTIYFARSYATSGLGTSYGNTISFTTIAPMSGTLVSRTSSCTIVTTGSSCSVDLDWSITNPEANPTAITANGMTDSIVSTSTATTTLTGTKSLPIPYLNSPRRFYLYNNSKPLAMTTEVSALCDIANGYVWGGTEGHCVLQSLTVDTSVYDAKGVANVGGTITPSSVTVSHGSRATFTVTPATGYSISSVTDNCGIGETKNGTLSGNTYTTGPITVNCKVSVIFYINTYSLSITKTGTGGGTISSDDTRINCGTICLYNYDYGTRVTLIATPDTSSRFVEWIGCPLINLEGNCRVTMTSAKSVTANFASVVMSVVANPLIYNVSEGNASVSFIYTPTTSSGTMSCKVVNYDKTIDITDWKASSPILITAPSTAIESGYGYYIKCKSNENINIPPVYSEFIKVNVVKPSVIANPLVHDTAPGATVDFTYTTSTVPSNIPALDPKVKCKLVDYAGNDLDPVSIYQSSSPIQYAVPNNIGSYGYYIKCKNTTVETATVTSSLITVNTSCGDGTWVNGKCVDTKGTLTSENCTLEEGQTECKAKLIWTLKDPVGIPTAITSNGDGPDEYIVVTDTLDTPQDGTKLVNVTSNDVDGKEFWLYNNGKELAKTIAAGITGTIQSFGCRIQPNEKTCPATIEWNTYNNSSTTIKSTVMKDNPTTGTIISTMVDSGTDSETISETTKFYLVYDGVTIASSQASPSCGPLYDPDADGYCRIIAPNDENTTFNANPLTVFKGKTSTLSWNSTVASSCSIKNETTGEIITQSTELPSGTQSTGTLNKTTVFSLTCINNSGSKTIERTVKTIDITVQEN